MQKKALWFTVLACLLPATAHAACDDGDGDGYGVYPNTSTLAGCAHDGIDCNDGDAEVHPFAQEVCGNGKDDNCRNGVDEGCGAVESFDGWRVMPIRSEGEFSRGELGGRAEQWLQGAARCIADPNVVYLSHDCSVIWRSRDGGRTWEKPLNHGLLLAHGQSIEVDPVDCDRLVIVADQAWDYKNPEFTGIYRSKDGGDHWDFVQAGPAMNSRRYEHNIAFAPSSADAQGAKRWYVALYNEASEDGHDQAGLYRSDDRGDTWQHLASLTSHFPVYEVQVSPTNGDDLFVASASGLYRSTDGGASIVPAGDLPDGQVTSVAWSPQDASVVYAVVRDSATNGLYRSTDGGASFTRLTSGDSLHQAVLNDARRIFVSPSDGDVFYVVPQGHANGSTAIRSEDGGVSFTTTTISLEADVANWRWGVNITGNFAFMLMSATDSNEVVAQGGGAALFRSTDGDAFENGSTLYTGANCAGQNYSIAFDPNDPKRIVVSHQDIGVYVTENGADWFVNRGVPHSWVNDGSIAWSSQWTVDIHPTEPDRFIGAVGTSFDRKIVRTLDAGQGWAIPESQGGTYFRVVFHPQDPNVVFAGDRRSLDDGASFAPLPIPAGLKDNDVQVMDVCRAQPDIVYTASRSGQRVLRSDDKGETWSQYAEPSGSMAPFDGYLTFAVDPVDCNVIYTLDGDRDLARYDGTNWTNLGVLQHVDAPQGYWTYVRSVMVDPNHPEVIYAGIFGSGIPSILRSTDAGATWEDISLNRFRGGVSGINVNPHSGEVMVGSCSGTWVLPAPYASNDGIYDGLVPRPSCLDGIVNGSEEGIDCGGDCPTPCVPGSEPSPDGGVPDGSAGSGGGGGAGGTAGQSSAGSGGASGGTQSGASADEDSGGCGCRTQSSEHGTRALWLLASLALLVGARRARQRRLGR